MFTGLFPAPLSSLATRATSATVSGNAKPIDAYPVNAKAPNSPVWLQTTPFGKPVVPPVYSNKESSPDRAIGAIGENDSMAWA
ncbi:unannotated protein [freshwater metagenome]|uniref:Unannotated protein n=1 Tax=freshwater metagenome TaxID=449393 RepID=A0A6J7VUZ8_9ZZZZ